MAVNYQRLTHVVSWRQELASLFTHFTRGCAEKRGEEVEKAKGLKKICVLYNLDISVKAEARCADSPTRRRQTFSFPSLAVNAIIFILIDLSYYERTLDLYGLVDCAATACGSSRAVRGVLGIVGPG